MATGEGETGGWCEAPCGLGAAAPPRCIVQGPRSAPARLPESPAGPPSGPRPRRGPPAAGPRPQVDWDKGTALAHLLETLGLADPARVFCLYIGDDRTDEDAFKGAPAAWAPPCVCVGSPGSREAPAHRRRPRRRARLRGRAVVCARLPG